MLPITLLAIAMAAVAAACSAYLYRRLRSETAWSTTLFQDLNKLQAVPEPAVPPSWLEERRRQRVILTTTADTSIEGYLDTWDDNGVALIEAKYLTGQATPLGGELWVPKSQVRVAQFLGGKP